MATPNRLRLWFWWLGAAASAITGALAPSPQSQIALITIWCLIVVLRRRSVWSMRPFLFGLFSAAVFVTIRVLYTALFAGAASAATVDGAQVVLWELPQVWLPGPFSSIHVFGVVTLQQLATAASDALRFAVVFVVFGSASSLVDLRRMLPSTPKVLGGVVATITIALGISNSLAITSAQLNEARIFRGLRSRWRLLLPLFETSVERAQNIASVLQSRGWQIESCALDAVNTTAPALQVHELQVSYDSREVLREVNLTAQQGELVLISGATGSGKSTLLRAIRQLLDGDSVRVNGRVRVFGHDASIACNIGYTTQRAETSFVAATVREELEFTSQNDQVEQVSDILELHPLLERQVESLSAGEAAIVALAAAFVKQPNILLLDEPIADLDEAATARVCLMIRKLRRQGTLVVIAEHRPAPFMPEATHICELRDGVLLSMASESLENAHVRATTHSAGVGVQPAESHSVQLTATREAVLKAPAGLITAVLGPNGSGKTTLLKRLALAEGKADTHIAFVSHNVDDYLMCASLREEFSTNDRAQRLTPGTTEGLVLRLVPDLAPRETHPRDCSAGTRVAIAIALQLSLCRPLLVLDEPTRGLDDNARAALAGMLRETAAQNIAVVIATHDNEFVAQFADRVLLMPETHQSPHIANESQSTVSDMRLAVRASPGVNSEHAAQ